MIVSVSHHKTSTGFGSKEYHKRYHQVFEFPTLKQVFPSLIAQEIVSVQPMSLPSDLLFYTDYTYGNNKNDTSKSRVKKKKKKVSF